MTTAGPPDPPNRPDTRHAYYDRMVRVLRHIQTHLDGALAPHDLAHLAHFSPFHFHRVFRAMVGESVGGHVRRLRLERAAGDLRHTSDDVLAIALRAGYEAHESFTRAFKAHFGLTPREWRAAEGDPAIPAAPSGIHYGPDVAVGLFRPIREEYAMMDATIKAMPALRLAALAHTGPYMQIGTTFERLGMTAGPSGLFGPGTLMLGVYHDDPQETPPEKCRAHAGVTIADGRPLPPGFEEVRVAPGEYAVGVHRGHYRGLERAYLWLMGQWIPSQQREIGDGPAYEIYRNTPRDTREEDLMTEICVPLKD